MRKHFIRLIGNKRQEEISLEKIETVILGGGRVGDVVVKTPMLKALKEKAPHIRIDVVVDPSAASLLENCPYVDSIILAEKRHRVKLVRIFREIKSAIKSRKKYDLKFDFKDTCNFIHILSLRIASPKFLVGKPRREKYGIKKDELTIFNRYIEPRGGHATEINMNLLEAIGIQDENRKYELHLGDKEEKYKGYFKKDKKNLIFSYKGSTEKKSMSNEDIKYFLNELPTLDENLVIHILTVPSDYGKMLAEVNKLNNPQIKLLPKTKDVAEAAAIVKYGDVLLSVDTGIVHIASAYNIPIVGIYPKAPKTFELFKPKSDEYYVSFGDNPDGTSIDGYDKSKVLKNIKKLLCNKSL